jgi:hypothetical protein
MAEYTIRYTANQITTMKNNLNTMVDLATTNSYADGGVRKISVQADITSIEYLSYGNSMRKNIEVLLNHNFEQKFETTADATAKYNAIIDDINAIKLILQ